MTSSAPGEPVRSSRQGRLSSLLVWALWLSASLALFGYVVVVNGDLPIADDWQLVPVYCGAQPFSVSWLWEQYNEHRVPLPRLLLVAGGALTGYDYRTGLYWNVLLLSGMSAALIFTAQRLRGAPSLTDAAFPLLLLHWGQYDILLISCSLNHVVSTALVGVVLVTMARIQGTPTPGQIAIVGVCTLAMPLSGANGLPAIPALVLWLLGTAIVHGKAGRLHGRGTALLTGLLALAALALSGFYVLGLERAESTVSRRSLLAILRTADQALVAIFGPVAKQTWPLSGLVVPALFLVVGYVMYQTWRMRTQERGRILGYLCVSAAVLTLLAAVGWGRGSMEGFPGFETRYGTLAAPLACVALLVVAPLASRTPSAIACLVLAICFLANAGHGYTRGQQRRERVAAILRDVRAGKTSDELAQTWASPIFHSDPRHIPLVSERFEMMRQAQQGPFKPASD